MNRASSATGWVRNPVMKSPDLEPTQASSYELGWTFNPITGCLNHINGMCKGGGFPCYACRLAETRLTDRYLANSNVAPLPVSMPADYPRLNDPFYPRFWTERLYDVPDMEHAKPKGVFVCDMGELFGDWIPEEWVKLIMTRIGFWCKQHRFYLLTKQPQNLAKWSPFPDNCWVGVTATDDLGYGLAIKHLAEIDATVKFISFEPLLESPAVVNLTHGEVVKWVIIGACTGTLNSLKYTAMMYPELSLLPHGKMWTLQPKIEWVQEIVKAADKAGVAVFLKDNLQPVLPLSWFEGTRWFSWAYAKDKQLRQEMPR